MRMRFGQGNMALKMTIHITARNEHGCSRQALFSSEFSTSSAISRRKRRDRRETQVESVALCDFMQEFQRCLSGHQGFKGLSTPVLPVCDQKYFEKQVFVLTLLFHLGTDASGESGLGCFRSSGGACGALPMGCSWESAVGF
jgi:hypothetical protein